MENFRKIRFIAFLFLSLLFVGCEQEEVDHTKMVLEGWIDADGHPVVMLHKSYSLDGDNTTAIDTSLVSIIGNQLVLFGSITIFDGKDSVLLTGRVDTNYMPPYIYTSVFMKGEVGKTYHISAKYNNFSVSAKSTIPSKATFDSICVKKNNLDKMEVIGYANSLIVGEHYIVMLKASDKSQYKVMPLGVFEASKPNMEMRIYNNLLLDKNLSFFNYFPKTDSVYLSIKFAHIGEKEFEIWNSFAAQSTTQGVFFMETHGNIPSNIEGGNGYFCGMGSSEYLIKLNEEKVYKW
ncbi:MAG: DUF4249 family protein [Paludibacteraceae bacterium]|nr:DUF4249 family protein [Paludibacteraceae bacterium]